MASISWHKGNNYAPTVTLEVWESAQNISENYSDVSYSLHISRPSNVSSTSSKGYGVTVNGVNVENGSTTIGGSGAKKIVSGTTRVKHESNGEKNISFSFWLEIKVSWDGVYLDTASATGDMTLSSIPRATKISSVSGGELGKPLRVNFTPASDSFTHKLYYKVEPNYWTSYYDCSTDKSYGSGKGYIEFTPGVVDAEYIASETGKGRLKLCTYNGSKEIGSTEKEIILTVPKNENTLPTLSALFSPDSDLESPFNSVYLQGYTRVKTDFSGSSAKYGAAIKKYAVSAFGAATGETVSGILTVSGNVKVTATVTDSRGFSASKEQEINVLPYRNPSVDDFTVKRCRKDGADYVEDFNGMVAKIVVKTSHASVMIDGEEENEKVVKLYRKIKSASSYGEPVVLTSGIYYFDGCEVNIAYSFKVEVTDTVGNMDYITRPLPTALAGLDIRDGVTGAAVGKYAEYPDCFEIKDDWGLRMKGQYVKDFLVDSGTFGIWTYRKWESGIAECFGTASFIVNFYGVGGVYYAYPSSSEKPILPFPFYKDDSGNPPVVSASCPWSYANWVNGFIEPISNAETAYTKCGWLYYGANANGIGENRNIYLHVIGRWK